ncbi:hypothetical protein [Demequina sp.]|uniref:hypothetical protein n=1 Tax=Demequina sp. TaxID=2050685 RepID=UPI0025C24250|nr:hypothetical protein [Demequina sp.]
MTSNGESREASTYLAWQSHLGVQMQVSRLRESYIDGHQGVGKQLVDASALILVLWRLRIAAQMSLQIQGSSENVAAALGSFDSATQGLAKLRNVTMHFDEYALQTDKRRDTVGDPPRLIEVGDLWTLRIDAVGLDWLGVRLDYDWVEGVACILYDAIQEDNNSQLGS